MPASHAKIINDRSARFDICPVVSATASSTCCPLDFAFISLIFFCAASISSSLSALLFINTAAIRNVTAADAAIPRILGMCAPAGVIIICAIMLPGDAAPVRPPSSVEKINVPVAPPAMRASKVIGFIST